MLTITILSQSLIPSHVISSRNVYPITVIGLNGVGVVGVEGGVPGVLAHTDSARTHTATVPDPLPVHALAPRLGLVRELGQGGALVREV